jgi:hypothetical protein
MAGLASGPLLLPATTIVPPREKDHLELFVSAEASTDDNVLQTETPPDRAYLGDVSARLEYRHRWRRSWFRLSGHGDFQAFAGRDDLSRIAYGGEGFLALAPSRNTSVTARQIFESSYARDLRALVDAGVALPFEIANLAESDVRVERKLSPRWSADLEATYRHLDFPSGRLVDGDEFVVSPGLRRRLRRSRMLSFSYLYEEGRSAGLGDHAHGVLAGISRSPSDGLAYDVRGGMAYLAAADTLTPIGGADVAVNRRKNRLGARYERRVQHALGLGRQVVTDLLGLTVSRTLHRRLAASAAGTFGLNTDPADPSFRYRSGTYSADLDLVLGADLGARAGCTHTRIDSQAYVAGPSTRCSISMGYRMAWR